MATMAFTLRSQFSVRNVALISKKVTTSSLNLHAKTALPRCSFLGSKQMNSMSSTFTENTLQSVGQPSPTGRRGFGLVVRAGGTSMGCTKQSASRKKRARVHGFLERMKTTSGKNVLKRRRQKGRAILCTQTNSPTGKKRTK